MPAIPLSRAGAEVAPAAGAAGQPGLQRARRDEARVAAADHEDPGAFGIARRRPGSPADRRRTRKPARRRHDRAERGRAPRRERPEPPEHRDHRAGDQERPRPTTKSAVDQRPADGSGRPARELGCCSAGSLDMQGTPRSGVEVGVPGQRGSSGHETVTVRRAITTRGT